MAAIIIPASDIAKNQFAVYGSFTGSLASATNTTLIGALTSQNIHVNSLYVYVATACTMLIKDGSGTIITSIPLAAGEKVFLNFPGIGLRLTNPTNALMIRQDSGGAVVAEVLAVGYRLGVA